MITYNENADLSITVLKPKVQTKSHSKRSKVDYNKHRGEGSNWSKAVRKSN